MYRPDPELVKMLKQRANQIRKYSIAMISHGGVGHPGGSLSAADIIATLYFHILHLDPQNPKWEDRDRFVLSKAHACPALYAALALRGFFPEEELMTYGFINSRLQSHTDMTKTPGIEISGGSLGQGLSVAVGMAWAAKYLKKLYRIFCMIGDGEANSGQIWEAAMSAAHYKLDNLIGIMDYNKIQAKGECDELMEIEPISDKWRAFGWEVMEIDGHDLVEILEAFHKATSINLRGSPTMIIAHTIKGKGVSFMENTEIWHTHPPNVEQAKRALEELDRIGRGEA